MFDHNATLLLVKKEYRLMKYVIAILLSATTWLCSAREPDTLLHKSLGVHGHYGFIIPHANEIKPVSGTNPVGIEFNFNKISTSQKNWNVFSSFWFSGISGGYYDFANPGITGGAFFVAGYAEPVIFHHHNFFFSMRGGAGLSYHTRIFDTISNPGNKFFATRFSFPVYVSARLNYKVSPKKIISLGANYNHISNGGIKQPNFGMNFPTLSLGLYYYPHGFPGIHRNFEKERKVERGIFLTGQLLSGYRVVDETDEYPEKGAFATGILLRASRQLTGFYSLNGGVEVIVDGAIKERIMRSELGIDHKRAALSAGQEFLFGRVAFTQYFGFYVYSPYRAFRNIYQKYELSYRFSPYVSVGTFLKAHLYVAELMGLQVSYTWHTPGKGKNFAAGGM